MKQIATPAPVTLHAHKLRVSPFLAFTAPAGARLMTYAGRVVALNRHSDPATSYWALRRTAILFDTPENPIEVAGPDALALLDRVLVRDVSTLEVGRAAYGIACYEHGGVLMDGILMRLGADRYWYVQADGNFVQWLRAHAVGMKVSVSEPDSQVLQVQGPNSMRVLDAACDGGAPQPFRFFGVAECTLGGQPLLISRTGWSGELGWEFYTNENTDARALWHHLMEAGRPFGLQGAALGGLRTRRIEAGIFDNLTDLDADINPFQAGLGKFVHMGKSDFIGKAALATADREQLLWGVSCKTGTPARYGVAQYEGGEVGRITVSAWSPHLKRGIGYVRFNTANHWQGKTLLVPDESGKQQEATVVPLPFYDPEKKISRGLETNIPQQA